MDLTDRVLFGHETKLSQEIGRKGFLNKRISQTKQPFHYFGNTFTVQEFQPQLLSRGVDGLVKTLFFRCRSKRLQIRMSNTVFSTVKIRLSENHISRAHHQLLGCPLDSLKDRKSTRLNSSHVRI